MSIVIDVVVVVGTVVDIIIVVLVFIASSAPPIVAITVVTYVTVTAVSPVVAARAVSLAVPPTVNRVERWVSAAAPPLPCPSASRTSSFILVVVLVIP